MELDMARYDEITEEDKKRAEVSDVIYVLVGILILALMAFLAAPYIYNPPAGAV